MVVVRIRAVCFVGFMALVVVIMYCVDDELHRRQRHPRPPKDSFFLPVPGDTKKYEAFLVSCLWYAILSKNRCCLSYSMTV